MAEVQQVNIHCECYHRHGPLYLLKPWAWGRPCRRCQRMMDRNVVVVPTQGPGVTVTPAMTTGGPSVMMTTTTAQTVPVQQQLVVTQVNPPARPPAYTETVIVSSG